MYKFMCMWLFGPHSVYNGKQWDNGLQALSHKVTIKVQMYIIMLL